jgi:hypothetical protein
MPETTNNQNPPAPEAQTPPVRMTIDQALDQVNVLTSEKEKLAKSLDIVTKERDQAKRVLNAQVHATLMNKARNLTMFPETVLAKMGNDELENVVKLAELIKRPTMKSIKFGADTQNPNDGLIDLYSERIKDRRV